MENYFKSSLEKVLKEVSSVLIEKNNKYGDSALNPIRVFSNQSSIEQLKVRIDDKLKRIQNQSDDEDEDVILDLIGYLVLLRIALSKKARGK